MAKQTGLAGWGRTFVPGREVRSEDLPAITRGAVLTRGLGRSYGDASLPPARTLEVAGSSLADRLLGFDPDTGVLRAEAGLVLSDMNRLFLPRGFFTPVTPGTRFVTLGGMVASDVHGKNHHVDGTIGRHVLRLRLQLADGRIIECCREHEPELFRATLGGMGLTGHILEVELKLHKVPSPWIYRESFRLDDLDALLTKLKEAGKEWPFTVAWIDTIATGKQLGRGILYCGRWAEPGEAPEHAPKPQKQKLALPFALPSGLLNRFTIAMFNRLVYYAHNKPHKQDVVDPDTFFYPLDAVRQWNLAYGARGVTQHQSVIPVEAGAEGIRKLIELLAETGASSFLSVVKDCGAEGEGLLSFPRPGMSLALDIPITENTQDVIDGLNKHVLACGGRIYLTKDGFTKREDFLAMEPRLPRFLAVKRQWDPEHHIHSALSDRLFGAPHVRDAVEAEQHVEHPSAALANAALVHEENAPSPEEPTLLVPPPPEPLVDPPALVATSVDAEVDDSFELDDSEAEPSLPPPVPAAAYSSRPPAPPSAPPSGAHSIPPPPPRALDASATVPSSVPPKRLTVPLPPPPSASAVPEAVSAIEVAPAASVAPVVPAPASEAPPPVVAHTPSDRPLTRFSSKATLMGLPALIVPGLPDESAPAAVSTDSATVGARKDEDDG